MVYAHGYQFIVIIFAQEETENKHIPRRAFAFAVCYHRHRLRLIFDESKRQSSLSGDKCPADDIAQSQSPLRRRPLAGTYIYVYFHEKPLRGVSELEAGSRKHSRLSVGVVRLSSGVRAFFRQSIDLLTCHTKPIIFIIIYVRRQVQPECGTSNSRSMFDTHTDDTNGNTFNHPL